MQGSQKKEIQQLLKVRKVRLENLQNASKKLEMARVEAESRIEYHNHAFAETQIRVKHQEDENLKALMTEKSVHKHRVIKFIKIQLHGIQQLKNAHSDIQSAILEHERCQTDCIEAIRNLKQAEKNIIKLEEMKKLLWVNSHE